MTQTLPAGLELRSTISSQGELTIDLASAAPPEPGPDEVVVRVQAAPVNPSDLFLLLGPADLSTLVRAGTTAHPILKAAIPSDRMAGMGARLDQPMKVGNEGAGTVVRAGDRAQAMLGRVVGMIGGAMYAQYRTLPAAACIVAPDGAEAVDCAAMFVNPLTALAMLETMRRDGHTALVHTAAASNLGRMLNRICLADGVKLVNVVRSAAQAALLRAAGAAHVVDSSDADFLQALTDAIGRTGATIAFDAVGGGHLANTILHAMEAVANRDLAVYNRYGSGIHKQVYIYGALDQGPTIIDRGFGFAWGVSGFLLTPFLARIGQAAAQALRERVRRELKTNFASRYTRTVSLRDALDPTVVRAYAKRATGEKYLIDPSL